MTSLALFAISLLLQAGDSKILKPPVSDLPIIHNERVNVWDTSKPRPYANEFIAIQLSDGSVWSGKAGSAPATTGRTIIIELKNTNIPPLANTSGYPNAFPRPGSKKVLESKRVVVWDYTWSPGVPTPMHFHDKDVVVTYLKDGTLKSTTNKGEVTMNDYKFADVKFNKRDRTHTETLAKGSQRAIIVEFK